MVKYIFYFVLIQIALLVPSFYFYRFVFRKSGIYKKAYPITCTILFPFLFTFLFTIINSIFIYPKIRSEKFDSQKWKTENSLRYRMVNDIMNNHLLIGKTKQEVIEILGKDAEEGPCNNCIGYLTNEPDQGLSIDHEVLEINFDNQNKVTSLTINAW